MAKKKPWVKLHRTTINDPKVMSLDPSMRWFWVEMLCVADDETGAVDIEAAAGVLRMSKKELIAKLDKLVAKILFDKFGDDYAVHNWGFRQKFDQTATERKRRQRERERHGNVTPSTVTNERDPSVYSVESVPLCSLRSTEDRISNRVDSYSSEIESTHEQAREDWSGYDRMIGRSLGR